MALGVNIVTIKAPQPFEATTIEERASACELSVEEFILFSGIVEAESNRSTDGDLEGRIMIALTIWNRVHDSRFPDSVTEVISQHGQFSTYRRSTGSSCVSGTVYSDEAVIRAYEWIESGEVYPEVLFFNCRGYNNGTAYDRIGGNYFMTLEPMIEEVEE
jgi:hypothetical protein